MLNPQLKFALVEYPTSICIIYHPEHGVVSALLASEHLKIYGKYSLSHGKVDRFDHFEFNNGLCVPNVRPVGNALELSSRAALILLVKFALLTNKESIVLPRDYCWLFTGADLANISRWDKYVLTHVTKETPMSNLPNGQTQRISVREERKRNNKFWQNLIDRGYTQ